MIPQKTVQEIIDTAKIEDVVGDFVNLKRAGSNLKGLCPFHNEKTPSFVVSPAKNLCKCFGCGKGGDPVRFIMNHENMSFPEALRYLAERYNIEIVEKQLTESQRREKQIADSLFITNQYATDYFHKELMETDEGKSIGLSYFKERGFREETIEHWHLGYTSKQKNSFTLQATQDSHNPDLLKKLGLTTQYGSDFYRERVMFPIRNLSGKIIGFGGRILQKDAKAAKYINSPESDIYNKSRVLFGAYYAKSEIRKLDECILVEGYTDVISLHQSGITNVVASSGTSLTVGQIQLVSRFTKNMKILYDGDNAGIKAALRGLDLVLEQDMNVKVVLLPDGEDPDSYLQKVGTEEFKFFKTKLLLEEAKNDPVKKTRLIGSIIESIAKIPNVLKRSLYIKECASIMDVEEKYLVAEANRILESLVKKSETKRLFEKRRAERERAITPKKTASSAPNQKSNENPYTNEPSPEDLAALDAIAAAEEQGIHNISPRISTKKGGDAFKEKEIIRILITGCNVIFDKEENITVGQFVLANIQDVLEDFDNLLYHRVATLSLRHLVDEKPLTPQFYIGHEDEEIAQLALDLSTSPNEYSENWQKKWGVTLQTQPQPEENFTLDSVLSLKRFKLAKLIRMSKKSQDELKAASEKGDLEAVNTHLKMVMKLKTMSSDLAKELNTVVFK
jgi:DNA primase